MTITAWGCLWPCRENIPIIEARFIAQEKNIQRLGAVMSTKRRQVDWIALREHILKKWMFCFFTYDKQHML